jgi:hypothetical protein
MSLLVSLQPDKDAVYKNSLGFVAGDIVIPSATCCHLVTITTNEKKILVD